MIDTELVVGLFIILLLVNVFFIPEIVERRVQRVIDDFWEKEE